MLKNRLTNEWTGRDAEARAQFGAMKDAYDTARANGDFDIVATVVGEAAGLIHDRPGAAEIMQRMAAEANVLLKSGSKLVSEG